MALVPVTVYGNPFTSSEVTFLMGIANASYTDGDLLIGNNSGGLSVATLTQGSGITITNGNGTITIASTGGSTGYQQPTGTVNGNNQTFVWATAPKAIVVDQGRTMQQTSSDGTVNWTGTTTTILTIAPTFDIFGVC